jgi:hypothetical protein
MTLENDFGKVCCKDWGVAMGGSGVHPVMKFGMNDISVC